MMYEELASYYDALVKDDQATQAWVRLIEQYLEKGSILELACGSGEITNALALDGFEMHASDISLDMINVAKAKHGSERVDYFTMDMCEFQINEAYDGILCLCDSFNYILHKQQVKELFQHVWNHLHEDGYFIMDMHSLDRLREFEEEYNEVGHISDTDIQWTITSDDERIYQNFAFYHRDGTVTLEQHVQRVYDPLEILELLEAQGFETIVLTDFVSPGICEGEKQFYVSRKVKR